jgi:hypothetical protein
VLALLLLLLLPAPELPAAGAAGLLEEPACVAVGCLAAAVPFLLRSSALRTCFCSLLKVGSV